MTRNRARGMITPMDEIEYTNKRAVGAAEVRYVLEGDALRVESVSGGARIPLSAISEIRLHYQPNRFESDVYECTLATADGAIHRIFSRYAAGVLDFKDQGPQYCAFVRELCLRCSRTGAPVRFAAGVTSARFTGNAVVALAGMALLFLALFLLPIANYIFIGVRLVVIVPLLIVSILWFVKNRPARFPPDSIPAGLLPKG
jgi:hypothetical protein